jgi:hypothetical protein
MAPAFPATGPGSELIGRRARNGRTDEHAPLVVVDTDRRVVVYDDEDTVDEEPARRKVAWPAADEIIGSELLEYVMGGDGPWR